MASKSVFNAMEVGDWEKVKEIIATASWTPADLEEQYGDMRDTLLITAAKLGNKDVVLLLLHAGATIEATNKSRCTPLIAAAICGHSEVVALLCVWKANIHAQDRVGLTGLHRAAQESYLQTIVVLLDRGADVEAKDTSGFTPLMVAARIGRLELVSLLVDRGANINTKTQDWSALILATCYGHVAVVKLLCGKGADLDFKNNDGHDALYLAQLLYQMPWRKEEMRIIIAVIQEEKGWRRVKNFVVFLHAGGLSSADWSVTRFGGSGSMPTTDNGITSHPDIPSPGVLSLTGKQSRVLENRDLCRIVASYIPKPL